MREELTRITNAISSVYPEDSEPILESLGEGIEIARIFQVFNDLNVDNIDTLDEIYLPEIRFRDPFHEIHGLDPLKDYMRSMYENVISCQFELDYQFQVGQGAVAGWTMNLAHRKLQKGRPLSVEGISVFALEGKIRSHRDYFDAGAFLYERLPLLGPVIRTIKSRIGGTS